MVKPIWEYFFDKKSHVANLPEKDSNTVLCTFPLCNMVYVVVLVCRTICEAERAELPSKTRNHYNVRDLNINR